MRANNTKYNKKRWNIEILDILKDGTKDFEMLNQQEARQSFVLLIAINGPPGTPYEGYSFRLEYQGFDIPFGPPKVRFLDIPWSPFVCPKTGNICCDILIPGFWSPALTVSKCLFSLISLLSENQIPVGQPGLNMEAAAEMRLKYSAFFTHAAQHCQKNHYKKLNKYKDEEKPPMEMPRDMVQQDEQFMKDKEKFMNNLSMKEIHKEKLKSMSFKKAEQKRQIAQEVINMNKEEDISKVRSLNFDEIAHLMHAQNSEPIGYLYKKKVAFYNKNDKKLIDKEQNV